MSAYHIMGFLEEHGVRPAGPVEVVKNARGRWRRRCRPHRAGWERMLAGHAEFQRSLAVRSEALLALGVPDQRPGLIGQLWDTLPVPDTVSAYRPRLLELCARLRASPVPASLQHDDPHDGNVFADGRVSDRGDASVSHPFGVLLVSLRLAGERFGALALPRLRDAYLEPWTSLAPRAELAL